jgi:thymidylate kinase
MEKPKVIVLDGYDGSGKTTLAKRLATDLPGGRYLKSFTGTLGNLIWWLLDQQRLDLVDLISRTAGEQMYAVNQDASYLIFDRHWLTLFTILTEEYYQNWEPLPTTFHCTAQINVITERLQERGEKTERSIEEHQFFLDKFSAIAQQYNLTTVDTSAHSPDESLELILTKIREMKQ